MNRIYQAFGAVAVVVIAIVFIISFQPQHGQSQLQAGPECAVEVRGDCVKGSQFWAAFRMITNRVPENAIKAQRLRESTMNGLIERELLLGEAKRLGISVSDDEVTNELRAGRVHVSFPAARMQPGAPLGSPDSGIVYLPVTDKNKQFSYDLYKKRVSEFTHLSEVEFREWQRLEIIASRVRDAIKARVEVSESEAKDAYFRQATTATVKYVKLERSWFANHVLDTSDAAIDKWLEDKDNKEQVDKVFEGRKASYGECRVARHILAKVDAEDPTKQEEAKKAAREKIEAAKKRIDAGEDFADVAKEVSEDGSAKDGGSLGCVIKGQMVKPFEDALFALQKDGDVSAIVETQFGFHIIKLESIKKGDDAIKIGQRETARNMYKGVESDKLANKAAKTILDAVKGGKSMEDALKDYLASVPKKAELPKGDKKKDEKAGDKGGKEKGGDKDKPKDAGDKDKPKDKAGDKDKPKDKAGDKDKPKDKAGDKDQKPAGDEDSDEDKADETPDDTPTVETSIPFRDAGAPPFDGASQEIDLAAMAFALKNPGDVTDDTIPLEQGTGFAIMQLKEKKPPSDEDWAKNRDLKIQSALVGKQADALTLYMARLRKASENDVKPCTGQKKEVCGNDDFLLDPADKAKAQASASAGKKPDAPAPEPEPEPEP